MNDLNWDRYKTLVHYICQKAAANPSVLGSIKLNKVLWYSDAFNFLERGKPITCVTYVKRQHGPVANGLPKAIAELVKAGKIVRGTVDNFSRTRTEFISIEDADVSGFSGEEIAVIDAAFEHVCLKHTAMSISEETHNTIWELAQMGEMLPLETVFAYHLGDIDEDDIAWAKEKLAA
jgi:antitoxin SocA-like protein